MQPVIIAFCCSAGFDASARWQKFVASYSKREKRKPSALYAHYFKCREPHSLADIRCYLKTVTLKKITNNR